MCDALPAPAFACPDLTEKVLHCHHLVQLESRSQFSLWITPIAMVLLVSTRRPLYGVRLDNSPFLSSPVSSLFSGLLLTCFNDVVQGGGDRLGASVQSCKAAMQGQLWVRRVMARVGEVLHTAFVVASMLMSKCGQG